MAKSKGAGKKLRTNAGSILGGLSSLLSGGRAGTRGRLGAR